VNEDVRNPITYDKLEDINPYGKSRLYGPVSATPRLTINKKDG
jgi:hypothetical protein